MSEVEKLPAEETQTEPERDMPIVSEEVLSKLSVDYGYEDRFEEYARRLQIENPALWDHILTFIENSTEDDGARKIAKEAIIMVYESLARQRENDKKDKIHNLTK